VLRSKTFISYFSHHNDMAAVTIQTEAFTTDGDKPEVLFIVAME
jgi:hypothetical protein